MALDMITLSLAKKYVGNVLENAGSLKGANCTIKSITETSDGNLVVFQYQNEDGTVETQEMTVKHGKDGVSPTVMTKQTDTGAIITITDVNGDHVASLLNGQDGSDGTNGTTPHIGTNGNWFIGESDTGVSATGETTSITVDDRLNKESTNPIQNKTVAEAVDRLSEEKVDLNQGSENVGKMLIVGADGNLTLSDIPENIGGGDVIGNFVDVNTILLTGDLPNGTYVFKFENTDGTYGDIGTYVVGGVVEYSITANLTNCTAVSGNAEIIEDGGTATLTFVANDGFVLTDTVSVSGAEYTWDSSTGTLVLSNPTGDVTIAITATKSGHTNIIDAVGYADGKRLSTTDGVSERDTAGYVLTGVIDIADGIHVIRTNGVDFNSATHSSAGIYVYNANTGNFSTFHKFNSTISGYTFVLDDDGNATITFNNTITPIKARLCGYGSGADLIVTIDEEITE